MTRCRRLHYPAFLIFTTLLLGCLATAVEAFPGTRIVIASVNTHGETSHEKMIRDLSQGARPDILLLQEVDGSREERRKMAQALGVALGLSYLHLPELPPSTNGDGLVTLSRFPLKNAGIVRLKHFDLVFRNRRRIALAQTVETPFGDILVFNLHLDTRLNPQQRLEQLSPVLEISRSENRPVVIAGDFNTGDYRWLYNLVPVPYRGGQTGSVVKRMAASGFQTPFGNAGPTHDHLGLRLDWVFLRGLKSFSVGIKELGFSDHHAIWTEVGPSSLSGGPVE
jgi:endonuclease/exonuclease/phosphatase family metal-dependent hydrolase